MTPGTTPRTATARATPRTATARATPRTATGTANSVVGADLAAAAAVAVRCHPCYSEAAHHRYARLHLPVAPRCNIACAYCDRRVSDCLHSSRPGLASRILGPEEVPALVDAVLAREPRLRVVGVAGPGEPLANPETLAALEAVRLNHRHLTLCLSTNGLALPGLVPRLAEVGVSTLTVTVNTVRPEVGARIYRRIRIHDPGSEPNRRVPEDGPEAARCLIERQFEGVRLAAAAGMAVKINTVLIPGVNQTCVSEVARRAAASGARIHNIVPLIPLGDLAGHRPPTFAELERARAEAGRHLEQFRLCRQCRADACGVPGELGQRAT